MSKAIFKNIGAFGSFKPGKDERYSGIVPFSIPKYVQWIEQKSPIKPDFFFYFDEALIDGLNTPELKYGYLFESRPYLDSSRTWGWVVPHILKNLELYKQHYKYIFTCWKDLVDMGPPFAYRIGGGTKLKENEKMIYNKSKLVSMFVSNSNVLPGHGKRLEYAAKYKQYMDLYGRGINEVSDKDYIIPYRDYMFVVAMDNCNVDYQFSEKLLDPILTGAIPIYEGSRGAVEKYFDVRGVLFADEINPEKDLSPSLYEKMLPYATDNFYEALKLPTIEDYIYETYFKEQK